MAKSAGSTRGRKLMRSHNVSSFLEESTESATSPKATMSVIVDVHNENSLNRHQRNDENGLAIELSDKEIKQSSQSSKVSSRASEASRNRSTDREARRRSSNDRSHRSHDEVMTMVSLDLIEESGNRNDFHGGKPRRRKQWNAATSEPDMVDSIKKPPRKRWSKDTGIIRLPETSDDASPLIDDSRRKVPVPAPRTSNATLVFDNPAFVSEDEVLRIETDHNRESTRIEMGRIGSDRSNIDEVSSTSGSSSRKQKQSKQHIAMSSDSRSSRTTRSLNGRKNSAGELDSSTSLGRVTDEVRSSSMVSEDRTSTSGRRLQSEATRRDRSSRRGERSLFEKKKLPVSDEVISSSVTKSSVAKDAVDSTVKKKRRKKRKQEKEDTKKDTSEKRYISVTIHRADVLEADYANVKRPMIMVHIVEARTGSYLKKVDGGYLRPLITSKFDFRENRSMIPVWEEELVFEHDYDAIVRREDGDRTVILFEVIDLLSFAEASLGYDRIGKFLPRCHLLLIIINLLIIIY